MSHKRVIKNCIKVQGKKKKVVALCSRPPFSRRSRAVTVKKCTKSVMHLQSCCFANLDLLYFAVLVAVAVDVA